MRLAFFPLALALAAGLAGCGRVWPGGRELRVTEGLPLCPAAPAPAPACDALLPQPLDKVLLAELAGDDAAVRSPGGLTWRRLPAPVGEVYVSFAATPEPRAAYVLERIRVGEAHDSVLSIGSNGGTVVWVNGVRLGASRAAARPARADQDLYTVRLRAGENHVLYRVITRTGESQLHRAWHPAADVPRLLAGSIGFDAYTDMPALVFVPDSSRNVALKPSQVRLAGQPRVHFRWFGPLGQPLADAGEYLGEYPVSLPLPPGFRGLAVLRTEVTEPRSGKLLFLDESPVFADSTAWSLARRLVAAPTTAAVRDPVLAARVDAVRAAFALGTDTLALGSWLGARALLDLYRRLYQPADFFRHPGPQVWGYRAADGTVQPYWLIVPPVAVAGDVATADPALPGLEFSVTHMVHSNYWWGRGRTYSWVNHLTSLAGPHAVFGVIPHLRGRRDFAVLGVEELRAITGQLTSHFRIDTAAVAMLVWSHHGQEALRIAQDPRVRLAWLGVAVPALQHDVPRLSAQLERLRRVRPGLRWALWRAAHDTIIPGPLTAAWVRAIRQAGFHVDYQEVPYSTHLGGFYRDIEAELFARVSPRHRAIP